ncbi:hypothetical protein I79_001719 [Cricetulus griseus]|uniref:Uncharacterized protein n=1 Tax=Cricetulus griseus TaxID=10029 RepID=G3GVI1_CRIGR|nr:hypothetical protein I79_001719 [Cricetulus griseus]
MFPFKRALPTQLSLSLLLCLSLSCPLLFHSSCPERLVSPSPPFPIPFPLIKNPSK